MVGLRRDAGGMLPALLGRLNLEEGKRFKGPCATLRGPRPSNLEAVQRFLFPHFATHVDALVRKLCPPTPPLCEQTKCRRYGPSV